MKKRTNCEGDELGYKLYTSKSLRTGAKWRLIPNITIKDSTYEEAYQIASRLLDNSDCGQFKIELAVLPFQD